MVNNLRDKPAGGGSKSPVASISSDQKQELPNKTRQEMPVTLRGSSQGLHGNSSFFVRHSCSLSFALGNLISMPEPNLNLTRIKDPSETKSRATLTFIDRVITVSTGALALSITFRESLLSANPSHVWVLKIAWVSLCISAISGVFLHLAPASSVRAILSKMKDDPKAVGGTPNRIFKILFLSLFIALPAGLASLMIFGILNAD